MGYVPPKLIIPESYTAAQREMLIDEYYAHLLKARGRQCTGMVDTIVGVLMIVAVILSVGYGLLWA
jgi:hypothetical protein